MSIKSQLGHMSQVRGGEDEWSQDIRHKIKDIKLRAARKVDVIHHIMADGLDLIACRSRRTQMINNGRHTI